LKIFLDLQLFLIKIILRKVLISELTYIQITNITLSIDEEVYKKMRKYSEVKWSEFVRKCVQKMVEELESIKSNIYEDEGLLAENWLSKEDMEAWKDL
jgi:hypothetical protein